MNIKIVGKPMLDKFLTGENVKVSGEIAGRRHILRTLRMMCLSGVICLSTYCEFSTMKFNSLYWSSTKRTSSSFHRNLTCSRHDYS
jgi:hypothetical protein